MLSPAILAERLLDNPHTPIALLDREMRFVRVNEAYAAADGRPVSHFAGRNHFELYPHEENEKIFRRVAAEGETFTVHAKPFEYASNPERGTTHWDWTLVPIADEDGATSHLLLILLDVTERIRALESSELKSRFTAVVNHELRTPLNAILGCVELMDEGSLDAHNRECLELLRKSGLQLREIVENVLEIAKIEHGDEGLVEEPFDLRALLEAKRDIFSIQAAEGVMLELEVADSLPRHVMGDVRRVRDILRNLISNAVKHTERGEVRIGVAYSPDAERSVTLKVSDTGSGIPEHLRERIFEPYVQLGGGARGGSHGVGLGLAIVRRHIDALGGDVELDSGPEGGTTFTVRLPLRASGAMEARPRTDAERDPSSEVRDPDWPPSDASVLLVEDNEVNTLVLRRLLQSRGFESITSVSTGAEALEALEAMTPMGRMGRMGRKRHHAVLLDLHLPDMSGFELMEKLRARAGEDLPPVVAVTADATGDVVRRCREAGMAATMTKPILGADIDRVLRSVIPTERRDEADPPAR